MPASISLIVPTHNRVGSLQNALRSALAQQRQPLEIIVVCDGCTDGSADAARALGVRVLEFPKGPGLGWVHRNEALAQASGDLVAYLADDDLHLPDHLVRVGELFDAAAGELDLVQGAAVRVGRDGSYERYSGDWSQEAPSKTTNRTPMSAVAHRRALAGEVGGWPEQSLEEPGDLGLWRRMIAAGARSAPCLEPTVLFVQAWDRVREAHVHDAERVARGSELAAQLSEPRKLTLLRSRIAAGLARADSEAAGELMRQRDEHAAARAELKAQWIESVLLRDQLNEARQALERTWLQEIAVRGELEHAREQADTHWRESVRLRTHCEALAQRLRVDAPQ